MTTLTIYGNSSPTWGNQGQDTVTWGTRFQSRQGGYVTALRWYDFTGSSAFNRPTKMALFDDTGTAVVGPIVPSSAPAVGWHNEVLATPFQIDANRSYTVAGFYPAGHTAVQSSTTGYLAPTLPLVQDDNRRFFTFAADIVYPTTGQTTNLAGVDVIWQDFLSPDQGGSGGTGPGSTTGDLAAWFSPDVATLPSSDPGFYPRTIADTNTKVTAGLNLAGGLQGLSDSLAHTLQMASDYVAGRTATYFTDLKNRLIGASGGGGSAFFGPGGTQVAEGVETLLAQGVTPTDLGAAVALLRERLTLSPDLADTTRWTLVDTVTGEGDALVELQADLFRITIGDAPGTHGPQLIGGAEWRPRWGWVAPRIHGSYLQRQPLVDLSPIAVAPGLFMDGLLLYSHPGFTWTVEAFVLDRA